MIESIAKVLLNYLSNIVGAVLPDDPEEKEKETIKNSAISAYAIGKTFGSELVESTETEIDDKVLSELLESCEEAAKKYDFSLDATKI